MIGGGGEQRTLKLVAQYADACNIGAGPDAAHKLDVLRAHCDAVGRDYEMIEKTAITRIDPSSTTDDIVRTGTEMANSDTQFCTCTRAESPNPPRSST
jgi:alkanesulfonate monooxygenase